MRYVAPLAVFPEDEVAQIRRGGRAAARRIRGRWRPPRAIPRCVVSGNGPRAIPTILFKANCAEKTRDCEGVMTRAGKRLFAQCCTEATFGGKSTLVVFAGKFT